MDIEDLKAEIAAGRSIEEAAQFLCRSGAIYDVARKAEELGCTLAWNWPQKKKGIAPYLQIVAA
jgi:hypothetical protein